ncbi:hypothetical protein HJC23_007938 [Cyclotella cryptica]|uniref:Prokaryotic-type class I peptide chain release factors domain-containing protein n=1 Tax=Cyclotella cryptica TaxID=29204 RepID=A0ABD3PB89_9STRA|eukprot:CCRYP_016198-RA/>CCRYP_016198-RA protein AED:0.19 eAED:0.19 QI:0/-1/0/1/-1/1/1/0/591
MMASLPFVSRIGAPTVSVARPLSATTSFPWIPSRRRGCLGGVHRNRRNTCSWAPAVDCPRARGSTTTMVSFRDGSDTAIRKCRSYTRPLLTQQQQQKQQQQQQQETHSHKSSLRNLSTLAESTEQDDDQRASFTLRALQSLPNLSPRIIARIRSMKARHDHVLRLLQDGGDQASLGKELSSLSSVSGLCDEVQRVYDERVALSELMQETKESITKENDADQQSSIELVHEIEEELSQLDKQIEPLSVKLLHSLVPILNPDDAADLTSADAVIDIRAGTGGDEAALFAAEIMAGYETIAKAGGGAEDGAGGKAWDVEILSVSRTDLGGVKEASLAVSSRSGGGNHGGGYDAFDSIHNNDPEPQTRQLLQQLGPYGFFQYESGVHRVQRVPVNDNKLQTSAVSVAVLPSMPDSQVTATLPPAQLRIETMRASGAGGQHVNTTESAVRVTHIPTGIMAYMQEERSQHKNKAKALKLVAARVYQLRKEQALKDRSATRSSLMGGGDRSERIRTYNFPQDRITDHRCKVSVTGVQAWLGGGGMVRKFGPHLYQMEREERVVALEEEDVVDDEDELDRSGGGGGYKKQKGGKGSGKR